ncbi:MAG TPA: redoxin domain-containing protein, partial [Bacteroidia bacterium]|nr:redoxin domain-containing protein [Bacteroidia bacterium]
DGAAAFPFPLLSDPSLVAFKAFRAYDDFEKMPLHGTFLIDSGGGIRWQEIGYEPFMKPEWLLEECQRLLALGRAEGL